MNTINTKREIKRLLREDYPYLLSRITQLPDFMEIIGDMPNETNKFLCVVGSRHHSQYGPDVCEKLIAGLSGYPIVIVSGLANGIDSIAHESALRARLPTIAFPGTGLSENILGQARNYNLGKRIVEAGGALISPFKREQNGDDWTYPVRNRIMAGISHATLIIEAGEKSGTLLTANDAAKFNRDLLVVPGSIFSPLSKGANGLLREGGIAVTTSEDIVEALGLEIMTKNSNAADITNNNKSLFEKNYSKDEEEIIKILEAPMSRDELIEQVNLPAGYVNSLLVELELKEIIVEREGLLMVNI